MYKLIALDESTDINDSAQVTSLHMWKKQGINHKILIGNRFHVTLCIVSPIICKQCQQVWDVERQRKVTESKQPQDCNGKTAHTQPRQIKQNENVLLKYMQTLKPQNLMHKWHKLTKTQRQLTINTKEKVAFW